MSLVEIKKHTTSEIIAMVAIISRMSLMETGSMLETQRKNKQPIKGADVRTYTRYLEEVAAIKKAIPDKHEDDEMEEEEFIENEQTQ